MKAKSIVFIFFFFSCIVSFSQSIQRTSFFSSTGSYSNIGSLQLLSNIGELMADTYLSGSNILSQGFVQPPEIITLIETGNNDKVIETKVFPNPVITYLTIELSITDDSDITIEVYDILGKNHILDIKKSAGRNYSYELNFEKLNLGVYFVRIFSTDKQFSKIIKVNKI